MDVMQAVRGRRSIRAYSSREVEDDKLKMVLEAGRLAPSASNMQDWHFVVVKDKSTRKALEKAAGGQDFLGIAPVVIVACGTTEKTMYCGQLTYPIDVSIALSFMILEAYELGLGTCWLGYFEEDEVKRILSIPEQFRVVAMTPLGYPSEEPEQRPRKPMSEFASFEKFSN